MLNHMFLEPSVTVDSIPENGASGTCTNGLLSTSMFNSFGWYVFTDRAWQAHIMAHWA